jgi:hypothetical protein
MIAGIDLALDPRYDRAPEPPMTNSAKLARPASLLLAAILGVTLGACGHSQLRIDKVCNKYCKALVDCNDNTDPDDCFDDCVETANNCESDEDIEAALDILADCTKESCNEVATCTVEAWVECNL